jgi:chromosome segregation protein
VESALVPLQAELETAEQRRTGRLAARQAEERDLAALRARERVLQERRQEALVRAQRARGERERLEQEVAEAVDDDADEAERAWSHQLRLSLEDGDTRDTVDEAAPRDIDALRKRLTSLQRDLRASGDVSPSVLEEYRELAERHQFLAKQSMDLEAALQDLSAAAHELEAHMRGRLEGVFIAVDAAFQECFRRLFGGGEARLVLTQPDDLLATGVDIVARPPGKKLQGLLSLSGGERALTIVALLFGLLKIHPTPFCLLDEVDAALDEANVQRFADLLCELARGIQFIVVTHNRATMEAADALYGVTMDANGVSREFSIKPRGETSALSPG